MLVSSHLPHHAHWSQDASLGYDGVTEIIQMVNTLLSEFHDKDIQEKFQIYVRYIKRMKILNSCTIIIPNRIFF